MTSTKRELQGPLDAPVRAQLVAEKDVGLFLLTQHFEAIEPWQPQIEQDDLRVGLGAAANARRVKAS